MPETAPLVALDADGSPSILNYNVPEPTSYTGRNLIKIHAKPSVFKNLVGKDDTPGKNASAQELQTFTNNRLAVINPNLAGQYTAADRSPSSGAARTAAPVSAEQAAQRNALTLNSSISDANLKAGKLPVPVKTQSGKAKVVYADTSGKPYPGIYLVETYRLSNYLGDYGAGKTVQTFSLLPGEKTKISIKSYKTSTSTSTTTNSIFDSYTSTTADDFENSVQSENSHTESKEKTSEWYADAEASGNWGVASASVSGGASGGTNSAREDFSNNVSSATEKHAQTASAQRDVTVNTSTQQTTTTGEESLIEREIQNINVGRTLNFVFRQLNQEYISILHLVDVRIGFFNGYVDKTMEVPVHEIDELLDYCVTKEEDRKQLKDDIFFALSNVRDYEGEFHDMVLTREYANNDSANPVRKVKMFNRQRRTTYDPQGRNITVDGVILSVKKVVLRTDAVIVEALVGASPALDAYSAALQDEKVRQQVLATKLLAIETEERQARLQILKSKDAAAAAIYEQMFQAPAEADSTTP